MMSLSMLWWVAVGRSCDCARCGNRADCPGVRVRRLLAEPLCLSCAFATLVGDREEVLA